MFFNKFIFNSNNRQKQNKRSKVFLSSWINLKAISQAKKHSVRSRLNYIGDAHPWFEEFVKVEIYASLGYPSHQVGGNSFVKSSNTLLFHDLPYHISNILVLCFFPVVVLILLDSGSDCGEGIGNECGKNLRCSPCDEVLFAKCWSTQKIIVELPASFIGVHLKGSIEAEN